MPQLKTFQLKDFRRITSFIPDEDEQKFPFLSYLLLKKSGQLVKTGLEMNAIAKVDLLLPQGNLFKDVPADIMTEDILIHEKTLEAIVDKTKSETITIEVEESETEENPSKVIVHDGRNYLDFQKMDIRLFNLPPEPIDGDQFQLDSTVLISAKIAKSFTGEGEEQGINRFVFVNKNYVAATNSFCLFVKQFDSKDFPKMVLTTTQVDILSQFETLLFSQNESYMFFSLPDKQLVYSFRKQEAEPFRFEVIIQNAETQMKNGAKHFLIEKEELVEFLDIVDKTAKSKVRPVTFMKEEKTEKKKKVLDEKGSPIVEDILYLNDTSYNKGIKRKIAIAGEIAEFTFNSSSVTKAFKSLPQHRFDCYIAGTNLIIKEKDNSYACFFGSQKVTNE